LFRLTVESASCTNTTPTKIQ